MVGSSDDRLRAALGLDARERGQAVHHRRGRCDLGVAKAMVHARAGLLSPRPSPALVHVPRSTVARKALLACLFRTDLNFELA